MRWERVSLESGRNALIGLLAQYKKNKRHKITVVFDGVLTMSEFAPSFLQSGVHVCFSSFGQSADDVIRNLVLKEREKALVVSSDRSIIDYAAKMGSAVMGSPQFYSKVINCRGNLDARDDDVATKVVHKRWKTQKKGPAKRLPKKERRNQIKTNKL